MRNFYIYKFEYKERTKNISSTIIFCDNTIINENALISEIGSFYENHSQTDKIIIIGGLYLKDRMIEIFVTNIESTFKKIPKRQETSLSKNIYIYTFGISGELDILYGNTKEISSSFFKSFLNHGLQNIFILRGGLVETEGSHHYVFPSGKHCDKFLRTGNILLFSSEIYFIAFTLMKHYDNERHNQIYCDTSSINSIAIALSELKNRFLETKIAIPIESFSSYNGLYNNELSYKNNALLLISASTSGNILNYITAKHTQISRSNILVLYFLDIKNNYNDIKDNVLCNLTYTADNPKGIIPYDSYDDRNCKLCKKGSHPVEVSGDVFLLEKPKINSVLIGIKDADENLSKFVKQFKSQKRTKSILKTNYKESNSLNSKYDIYIDYSELLKGLSEGRFEDYKKKLDAYINQFVPSNLKFIIHLNDQSSSELADYIMEKIISNYASGFEPKKISQDEITKEIPKDTIGSTLVVGSCISNGKNLLYLSRALRNYEGLRIIYFVGISRMCNSDSLIGLKTNLKQGNFGAETSTYIEVDKIFCTSISKNNNWQQELEFLNVMIDLLNNYNTKYSKSIIFFKTRKKDIEHSYSDSVKGLSTNLFFPKLKTNLNEEMHIRNNFAFFDFDKYVEELTQSDIYFTFNNVINSLRNSKKIEKSLIQTSFVRNLLSPNNFNRFNDGIIQASILRSAFPGELSYSIDFGLSLEMKNLLETIIKYYDEDQGEAILEFLYAIAIGKLSLKEDHLSEIIQLLKSKTNYQILECFVLYIENKILIKKTI
ncbi:hypothetical protein [Flavobacterium sp. LC2016-12]|uniref:hypothetical protein n=1 Tax=Flavobacterium sp. LC2016-12 TaxID=2783794 RepID=UPI00188A8169|nr:hypothetical protein [Flavobacterium sp. LC2016-12]MBF4466259.1 hypothetical protein [Flavobacterium sp. LC2016-12]